MANKRKYAYSTPQEEEYIFGCLLNFPAWAKSKLLPSELKILQSESSIRRFVQTATYDQKKLLLAKGGIYSVTLYVDANKQVDTPIMQDWKKMYKAVNIAGKLRTVLDDLRDNNVFVISSRQEIAAAYLVAQHVHTPYWSINQNYKRMYSAQERAKFKGLNISETTFYAEQKEADQARDMVANFFLISQSSENYIKHTLKLELLDVRIIIFLFMFRDKMVGRTAIFRTLPGYSKTAISNRLTRLVKNGYLDINQSNRSSPSYTVAEMGITVACEFLENITQKSLII